MDSNLMEVVNIVPCRVDMDFEKVEERLNEKLNDYRGLVVTGDSIGEAKLSRKEVNDIRTEIEDFRKKYKKYLTAPISAFEGRCKELVTIVDEVLAELDKGIDEVDAKRRQIQRDNAEVYRKEIASQYGISEDDIEIKSAYCNISATEKEVRADMESQALIAQIKAENARLKANEPQFNVTYEICGSQTELQSVSEFLKAHGITYKVTRQEKA